MNFVKPRFLILFILSMLLILGGCSLDGVNNTNSDSTSTNGEVSNVIDQLSGKQNTTSDTSQTDDQEISEEVKTERNKGKKLNGMEVHFIDVGQADSALIKLPEHNILIDAGDWRGNEVIPYLKNQGVNNIDILIGTHPHADHIGQMDKVIDNFKIGEVWMSGNSNSSQIFQRVLSKIDSKNIDYNEPRAGEEYQIGDLKIDILSPNSLTGDLNDDSIVTKLTYGEVTLLFTGDAEKSAEQRIVNNNQNLKSDILKVGHHGSDTSSTQSFVEKVNPDVAIISVGIDNQYNHPNKSVLDRLNSFNTKVYATSSHGSIVVKTDGLTYNINTQKNGEVKAGDSVKRNPVKNKKPVVNNTNPSNVNQTETPSSNNSNSGTTCININTADLSSLMEITHIGETRAKELIEKRPYNSIDELNKINGIANARVSDIKSQGIACVK